MYYRNKGAGGSTLLIRLCTLWFGLGLGIIALILFRSTHHIDFTTIRGDMLGTQQPDIKGVSLEGASQPDLQTASVLSSIGDKFI